MNDVELLNDLFVVCPHCLQVRDVDEFNGSYCLECAGKEYERVARQELGEW